MRDQTESLAYTCSSLITSLAQFKWACIYASWFYTVIKAVIETDNSSWAWLPKMIWCRLLGTECDSVHSAQHDSLSTCVADILGLILLQCAYSYCYALMRVALRQLYTQYVSFPLLSKECHSQTSPLSIVQLPWNCITKILNAERVNKLSKSSCII